MITISIEYDMDECSKVAKYLMELHGPPITPGMVEKYLSKVHEQASREDMRAIAKRTRQMRHARKSNGG